MVSGMFHRLGPDECCSPRQMAAIDLNKRGFELSVGEMWRAMFGPPYQR